MAETLGAFFAERLGQQPVATFALQDGASVLRSYGGAAGTERVRLPRRGAGSNTRTERIPRPPTVDRTRAV